MLAAVFATSAAHVVDFANPLTGGPRRTRSTSRPGVDDLLAFASSAEWERWLSTHHEDPASTWLRVTKKSAAHPTLTSTEAGDVAICYGWIDSIRRSLDAR